MAHHPALDPDESEPATRATKNQGTNDPPNPSSSKSNAPAGVKDKPCPNNGQNQIREWWKVVVETLTLAAVVWYACVASCQLTQMRNATKAAGTSADAAASAAKTARDTLDFSRRSFKQEERAYLWTISFNISNPPICTVPGTPRVCADVHVTNSGKTPAVGVLIHRYATFGPHAERIIKAMKIPAFTPSGDILGTTGEKWGTAATHPIANSHVFQEVLSGKMPLYVYGIVQYLDIFGDYHETGFCAFRLPNNGPFMACSYGNWFDKRPGKKQ